MIHDLIDGNDSWYIMLYADSFAENPPACYPQFALLPRGTIPRLALERNRDQIIMLCPKALSSQDFSKKINPFDIYHDCSMENGDSYIFILDFSIETGDLP